jgi:hypothetical protein
MAGDMTIFCWGFLLYFLLLRLLSIHWHGNRCWKLRDCVCAVCTIAWRASRSRHPPPVTCWLVATSFPDLFLLGFLFGFHLFFVFLIIISQFIWNFLSVSLCVCLTGSWWFLPAWLWVSFRPLKNSKNQLTWLSSTWRDWSSFGSQWNSFSGKRPRFHSCYFSFLSSAFLQFLGLLAFYHPKII